jgi:hypothetical protein
MHSSIIINFSKSIFIKQIPPAKPGIGRSENPVTVLIPLHVVQFPRGNIIEDK